MSKQVWYYPERNILFLRDPATGDCSAEGNSRVTASVYGIDYRQVPEWVLQLGGCELLGDL
jgi:hypothetical protein